MLQTFGGFVIPTVLLGIILFGLIKKVNVYEAFLEGAKEGAITTFQIMPAIIAILTAIGMLKASGALAALVQLFEPVCQLIGFPAELTPLAIIRPISGSGSLAVLEQVLRDYGPDSLIGRVASVMQGSTETTFYTIAVYYGAAQITKARYTLPCALAADFAGMVFSAAAVRILMQPL
ncbi:MAG: spore maturation protein [Oscillospiraceae bacterium]|nr:spore maturation protein [Oscillospiraceae bacterium]